MKNFFALNLVACVVVVVICVSFGVAFTRAIVESNLPTWLKFFLLR